MNENRDAATTALNNVDDIEKKIGLAASKTRESFEAMNGADTSANLALTVARDAQQVTSCDVLLIIGPRTSIVFAKGASKSHVGFFLARQLISLSL